MNEIEHDGIVESFEGNVLKVRIVTRSACASCQVRNLCNPSEMKEKLFEIEVPDASKFAIGDRVNMAISEGQGILAVFLGYVIPVILLIGGLIAALKFGLNELASAGAALGLTGMYYFILYFTRKKTMKRFTFHVTRL